MDVFFILFFSKFRTNKSQTELPNISLSKNLTHWKKRELKSNTWYLLNLAEEIGVAQYSYSYHFARIGPVMKIHIESPRVLLYNHKASYNVYG